MDGRARKWVWLLGGGALAAFLFSRRGSIMSAVGQVVKAGQETAFRLALPAGTKNYAPEILVSAARYGLSPWLLAGVMARESAGGLALTPQGPAGTGDFTARGPGSLYAKYANPTTGLPPDGKGWGRGLMQIDYGVHNTWVMSAQWWLPNVSLDKASTILKDFQSYFSKPAGAAITVDSWRMSNWTGKYGLRSRGPYRDPRPLTGSQLIEATLAAYNAGPYGVLQAIAAGLPPSAPTTGGDYSNWVLARVASWSDAFAKLV